MADQNDLMALLGMLGGFPGARAPLIFSGLQNQNPVGRGGPAYNPAPQWGGGVEQTPLGSLPPQTIGRGGPAYVPAPQWGPQIQGTQLAPLGLQDVALRGPSGLQGAIPQGPQQANPYQFVPQQSPQGPQQSIGEGVNPYGPYMPPAQRALSDAGAVSQAMRAGAQGGQDGRPSEQSPSGAPQQVSEGNPYQFVVPQMGAYGIPGAVMNYGRTLGGKPGENLTKIYTPSGRPVTVNKTASGAFSGLIGDLEANGYKVDDAQGYNDRTIAGTNEKSEHAYGMAIDINPAKNPRGGTRNIPEALAHDLRKKWGMVWGGDWSGKDNDPMHFQWGGPQAGTQAQQTQTATPASPPTPQQTRWNPLNWIIGSANAAEMPQGNRPQQAREGNSYQYVPSRSTGSSAMDYANAEIARLSKASTKQEPPPTPGAAAQTPDSSRSPAMQYANDQVQKLKALPQPPPTFMGNRPDWLPSAIPTSLYTQGLGSAAYVGARTIEGAARRGDDVYRQQILDNPFSYTPGPNPTLTEDAKKALSFTPTNTTINRAILGRDELGQAPNQVARYMGNVGEAIAQNPGMAVVAPGAVIGGSLATTAGTDVMERVYGKKWMEENPGTVATIQLGTEFAGGGIGSLGRGGAAGKIPNLDRTPIGRYQAPALDIIKDFPKEQQTQLARMAVNSDGLLDPDKLTIAIEKMTLEKQNALRANGNLDGLYRLSKQTVSDAQPSKIGQMLGKIIEPTAATLGHMTGIPGAEFVGAHVGKSISEGMHKASGINPLYIPARPGFSTQTPFPPLITTKPQK